MENKMGRRSQSGLVLGLRAQSDNVKIRPPGFWACWGPSHWSCACRPAALSSSPDTPGGHPRRSPTPPRSSCCFHLAGASNVWPPGSPSPSCSEPSELTSSPALHGPLEEKEAPGPGRRAAHKGGTPPGSQERALSQLCQLCAWKQRDSVASWPLACIWARVPPGRAAAAPVDSGSAAGWMGLRAAGSGPGTGPAACRAGEQSRTPGWSAPASGWSEAAWSVRSGRPRWGWGGECRPGNRRSGRLTGKHHAHAEIAGEHLRTASREAPVPVLPRPAWQWTATLPSATAKAKTFTPSMMPTRDDTP